MNHPEPHDRMTVPAAGALVWRRGESGIEVAVVHRNRYNDWSWPKGKLDPGESFAQAAVREVHEETGLEIRLGVPLVGTSYPLETGKRKVVQYWAAEVVGGTGELEFEVDEVRWLSPSEAPETLTYKRDLPPLDELMERDFAGELHTWPLIIVRHAHAIARTAFRGSDDCDRPLSERGEKRAQQLAGLLSAWKVERLVTSSSERCRSTIAPFSEAMGLAPKFKASLSEEGFERNPDKAQRQIEKAFAKGRPTVICTHGPLIPTLLGRIAACGQAESTSSRTLRRAVHDGMDKGEALVCQMVSTSHGPTLVSAERFRPSRALT